MSKLLRILKSILALPFKTGLWLFFLALGTCLGTFGPTIWETGSEALAWWRLSSDTTFDPAVLLSPEKELDLIRTINEQVEPRLKRACILIRKQQADIEYLREKCRFIEQRVADDGDERNGGAVLSQLAAAVSDTTSASPADVERFEQLGGPTWLALRNRSRDLERSLEDLLRLQERVDFLGGKLEERRLVTLRYAPEEVQESVDKTVEIPEVEESRALLQDVHESLFKTIYALDPSLVKKEKKQIATTVKAKTGA